jgi:hypothetical protein
MARTLIFFFLWGSALAAEFGVTYDFSGGRFGDCLMSYLHAKWIAYEKNIPLIYRPFIYSSHLVLDEKERAYASLRDEPRIRVMMGNGPINSRIQIPLLYVCPYFPEDRWERTQTRGGNGGPWYYFDVNWKDKNFRKIVREMVSPKKELKTIIPPEDRISIALHIREGGDFDAGDKYESWPLKFPHFDFYIDSLVAAIALCKDKPLYCYVFTDALQPEELVKRLEEAVPPNTPIVFDYRRKNNRPSANVLEDFFSFFNFNILIRPQSNFSMIPPLMHDFAAVYSPDEFAREGGVFKITHIRVEVEDDLLQRLLQ